MSSNRTKPKRLLPIVVFIIGVLILAWISQPPTLPLFRAFSRVFTGGHFEERWVTGNDPYELVWSSSPMIDLPKQGAPWKHTGTHLTQGVTFENRRVPEGFQRGVWAKVDMNDAGETFQLDLAPMRRWKGTLTFESETSAPLELQLEVAAPWRDIGSPGSWLQGIYFLSFSIAFLGFIFRRRRQESPNGG
jgi:hypothetical protein